MHAQEPVFGPTVNLSSDPRGGIFPRVLASGGNVYVIWDDVYDTRFVMSNDNAESFGEVTNLRIGVYTAGKGIVVSGNHVYVIGGNDVFFRASHDYGASFGEKIDINGNFENSDPPQIAASEANVYAVWSDDTYLKGDIYFRASNDNGDTFGDIINISNDTRSSVRPQVAASESNVYVVWLDESGGHNDIFLKVSNDNGRTFGDKINISNDPKYSSYPQITASGNNVYVIWYDRYRVIESNDWETDILLRVSDDNGASFGKVINLTEETRSADDAEIVVSGRNVYVTWNDGIAVFFRMSDNNGTSFSDTIKLNEEEGDNGFQWPTKIGVSGKYVYVLWTDEEDIFLRTSNDNGRSFGDVVLLSGQGSISGGKGGIDLAVSGNNVYAVWHDRSTGDWEILFRAASIEMQAESNQDLSVTVAQNELDKIPSYGFVGSGFLRLNDEQYPEEARTGEIVLINGTMLSMVNKDMSVYLILQSDRPEGVSWRLTDVKPAKTFVLPSFGETRYQFMVQFFKPGKFFLQSNATVLEALNSTSVIRLTPPVSYQGQGSTVTVVGKEIRPSGVSIIPTAEQLKECSELGIDPYDCSEQKILGSKCIGMNCNPSLVNTQFLMNPDVLLFWGVLAAVFGGVGAALFLLIRKKRASSITQ